MLVFLVALAGAVDGAAFLGAPLAFGSAQNRPFGYLEISLLLLGCAVGAAPGATMAANILIRTSRGRYLPVLALTAIAAVAFAVAQIWLVQHLLHEPSRTALLLPSVIVLGLVATVGATVIRVPVAGPRRRSALMIGVVLVVVIFATFTLLAAYALSSTYSTFSWRRLQPPPQSLRMLG